MDQRLKIKSTTLITQASSTALVNSGGRLLLPGSPCRSLAEAARVLNMSASTIKMVLKLAETEGLVGLRRAGRPRQLTPIMDPRQLLWVTA